jgi:hypothetical protein
VWWPWRELGRTDAQKATHRLQRGCTDQSAPVGDDVAAGGAGRLGSKHMRASDVTHVTQPPGTTDRPALHPSLPNMRRRPPSAFKSCLADCLQLMVGGPPYGSGVQARHGMCGLQSQGVRFMGGGPPCGLQSQGMAGMTCTLLTRHGRWAPCGSLPASISRFNVPLVSSGSMASEKVLGVPRLMICLSRQE